MKLEKTEDELRMLKLDMQTIRHELAKTQYLIADLTRLVSAYFGQRQENLIVMSAADQETSFMEQCAIHRHKNVMHVMELDLYG